MSLRLGGAFLAVVAVAVLGIAANGGARAQEPEARSIEPLAVPSGPSLVGWFGGPTDSAQLLAANPALQLAWWFDPALDQWTVDAAELPQALRRPFAIARGTGFLVVARYATVLLISSSGLLPANVCPENPSPPSNIDPAIRVGTPFPGSTVVSPVKVVGQVSFAGGAVSIQIDDADGALLAGVVAQAVLAAPLTGDVKRDISFTVTEPQPACIEVFERDVQTGERLNVLQIPVLLSP